MLGNAGQTVATQPREGKGESGGEGREEEGGRGKEGRREGPFGNSVLRSSGS
jgi:hypothetical protein